jgi:transcriptional regulator with XRE-family HTH domain
MGFYALNANMRLKDIFVQNLRKYRRDKKISQMTLAEKCGSSTSYIGQIEIGNRFPSLELIEKMAKVLEIKPQWLFFDESDKATIGQIPKARIDKMSNVEKEELIKRLTSAIRKVVKQIK